MKQVIAALCLTIFLGVIPALAAPPATITYQGYLTGADNAPLNSPVVMTLSLYTDSTGGAALWSEHQTGIAVVNGVYSVLMGSITPITLPFDTVYYLGVAVGSDPEMTPRQKLSSVPYAFRATSADKLNHACSDGEVLKYSSASSSWSCALAVGPAGPAGSGGATGATGPQGLQGVPGVAGAIGAVGSSGLDGKTVLNGAGDPITTTAVGVVGDFYIDTTNNKIYGPKTGVNWVGISGVSLVGPTGAPGAAGATGSTGAVGATGTTGTTGTNGATGATGPQGATGSQGSAGQTIIAGQAVLNGTSDPIETVGINGEFYINTTTNVLWGPKAAGAWPTSGVNMIGPAGSTGSAGPQGSAGVNGATGAQGATGLTGATGSTGAQGPQGVQGVQGSAGQTIIAGQAVLNGTIDPTAGIGINGEFYINTATNVLWGPKAAGAWPSSGVNMIGPQGQQGIQGVAGSAGANGSTGATGPQGPIGQTGATGATGPQGITGSQGSAGLTIIAGQAVLNGASNPVDTVGIDGEFYINTTTNVLWGPKASGTWPSSGVNMIGPSGLDGATGPQGPAGVNGAAGAQGVAGLNGATGATGATGAQGVQGIQGTQGVQGSAGQTIIAGQAVLNGIIDPVAGVGINGEFYINTTTNVLWGPKAAGAWPASGVNMIGPQGMQGIQGVVGPAGATGPAGAAGTTNASNISTGTLAVANGGTGATTLTVNNVLLGNGTSALQAVAPGTTGNVLTSNGSTWTSSPASGGGGTSLPSQTGNSGKVLTTNGTAAAWGSAASSLTTVPTGQLYANTAGGASTLTNVTTGYYNSAFGRAALTTLTTGQNNSGFGESSLSSLTTGLNNTASGASSLTALTTGGSNVAVGFGSGLGLKTGSSNVAVGATAMQLAGVNAGSDVAVGYSALQHASGDNNTAVGTYAMFQTGFSGSGNVGLGRSTGTILTTGSYNTYLGYAANSTATGGMNQIAIGSGATANADNQLMLGGPGAAGSFNAALTQVVPGLNNSATLGSSTNAWKGLYLAATSGTNTIGVTAPATVASAYTLTLPGTAGSASQVLTTNGSGVLSWTTPSGGSGGVTSVTGTSPVTVTGTTTPVISLGTVGVANGGTGLTNVGSTGQVLTVVSGAPAWSTPASGGGGWTTTTNDIANSNSGNVGIGTGATAPAYKLDVTGDVRLSGALRLPSTDSGFTNAVMVDYNGTQQRFLHFGNTGSTAGNLFVGVAAGPTSGITVGTGYNTGFGTSTLQSVSSGKYNNAHGQGALQAVATGLRNNAFGYQALAGAVGSDNVGIGDKALQALTGTSGTNNVAIGSNAGKLMTNDQYNTAVGDNALSGSNPGSNNIALGAYSGSAITGSNNIAIGHNGGSGGTIYLGNAGNHTKTYIAGIKDVTLAGTPKTVVIDTTTGQLGAVAASSGTVTSVAALTLGTTGTDLSSSVATDTSTPVITLNVPTASAANRGALSAADWTAFNGKASLVSPTFTTPILGVATGTSFNSITGMSSTATDIKINGTQSAGSLATVAKADHVHPTDTTRQAAGTNLTSIGSLSNGTGWLNNNGTGTFSYSTPSLSALGAAASGANGDITSTTALNSITAASGNALALTTPNASSGAASGITLTAGNGAATNGNGGSIVLTAGSKNGSGSDGSIQLASSTTLAAGKTLALSGSTSGTATLKAPAAVTSYTLTLPTTLGTSGQVLNTTDGSGTLAWTTPVSGSVTSVAALTLGTTGTDLTSSVATDTSTPVITLNVPTASASNRGALSAADWSTFNGKQAALTSGTNLKTVGGNSLLGSGDAGAIGIGYGGTGATTASAALSALGGAAKGANGDITSLTGLTTALSVGYGGTGAATAAINTVFAGPSSGSTGAPSFRTLAAADLAAAVSPGTSGNVLTSNGSTWASVASSGLPTQTANPGKYLTTDGSAASWVTPLAVGPDANLNTKGGLNALNSLNLAGGSTYNTAVGSSALQNLTGSATNHSANNNTAFGAEALLNLAGGATTWVAYSNIGVGAKAGYALVTGTENVAIGYQTLFSGTPAQTAANNVAVGTLALYQGGGSGNVAIGGSALQAGMDATANNNTAVGSYAGGGGSGPFSGTNNVFLGSNSGTTAFTASNQIAIGYGARAGAANQMVLGGDGSSFDALTQVIPGKNNSASLGSTTNAWTGLTLAGSTSGYIGLQAPATPSGYTLTLPTTAGTANQVLTTNGSGTLSWAAPASATNLAGGVAGAVPYQSATGVSGFSAAGTSGQVLVSGGTGAPTWTTNIAGNAANVTGTVAVANGGTGLTALGTANQVLTVNAGATAAAWVTPAAGGVTSVSGTASRVTVTGTTTPVVDIDANYVGQTSITKVGTVTTGTWSGLFGASLNGSNLTNLTAANLSGAVSPSNGGTGLTTLTANNVILGNGTSAVKFVAPTTSGNVLTANGTTWTSTAPVAAPVGSDSYNNTKGGGLALASLTGTTASNTAFGYNALNADSTAHDNTAFGYQALKKVYVTPDNGNTAFGSRALENLQSGSENTAIGYYAGFNMMGSSNVYSQNNTIVGSSALASSIHGNYNTAVGAYALNQSGQAAVDHLDNNNVAVGYMAGYGVTSGASNVLVGVAAGGNNLDTYPLTTGSDNVLIGMGAGKQLRVGKNNVVIGNSTVVTTDTDNQIAIGYGATTTAANSIQIGNASITSAGVKVAWTNPSDRRLKQDIVDSPLGLAFIQKLRPVTYSFITQPTVTHEGLIAQEVEAAAQSVGSTFHALHAPTTPDGYYSLSYTNLVMPLINATKELKAENDALKAENAEMKAENADMKAENADMKARLAKVEKALGL